MGGGRHGTQPCAGAEREKSKPASSLQGPRPHAGACPTRAALGRLGQHPELRGGGHNRDRGGTAEVSSLYAPFSWNSPPQASLQLPLSSQDTTPQLLTPPVLKHLSQNSEYSPHSRYRVSNLGVYPRLHLGPFSTYKASSTLVPQGRSLRPHPHLGSTHEPLPQTLVSPKELETLLQDLRRPLIHSETLPQEALALTSHILRLFTPLDHQTQIPPRDPTKGRERPSYL